MIFKANDGFLAQIFLDGIEQLFVTEIEASEKSEDPISGYIITFALTKNNEYIEGRDGDLKRVRKEGIVYWKPWTDESKTQSQKEHPTPTKIALEI